MSTRNIPEIDESHSKGERIENNCKTQRNIKSEVKL